eukprot:gene21134-biopygen7158
MMHRIGKSLMSLSLKEVAFPVELPRPPAQQDPATYSQESRKDLGGMDDIYRKVFQNVVKTNPDMARTFVKDLM